MTNPKKPRKLPRTHRDFWKDRLYHESYLSDGKRLSVPEFSVRIAYKGRRERFALNEANQIKASERAKDIYLMLVADGWEATLEKFKPAMEKKVIYPTVGEYIQAARAVSGIKSSTFEIYVKKLRSVVAGVMKINPGKSKFDCVKGGNEQFREKVDAVPLNKLTPDRVQKWIVGYLSQHANNPAKLNAAKTTINTLVRNGRCLFVPRIIRHLGCFVLPSPLPFEGVEPPKYPRKRYKSKFSALAVYGDAQAELMNSGDADEVEMFYALTLALFAGLRRKEIDTLQWTQIDFVQSQIRIETNEIMATKSGHSEGVVSISPDVLSLLENKRRRATGVFVIESTVDPRPQVSRYHHYRANRVLQKLTDWLKAKGVDEKMPLHALRKEFGSAIARRYGIFAASEALRHGDIRLTRDYYLAADNQATLSPGDLLRENGA